MKPGENGYASIYTLIDCDRVDEPGGKRGGPPGGPAAKFLTVKHCSAPVPFEALYEKDSPFVLYAVEAMTSECPFLVFLELPPAERGRLWKSEAFIDRGIRKLVANGSRVAVASFDTAEAFCSNSTSVLERGEWGLSFVWNTGRCGSTLLHKAVSAFGVASLSEPHWLDQVFFNPLPDEALRRALRTCVTLEALTARAQPAAAVPGWAGATRFSFNPKAGGANVAEAVVAVFPQARHAFMYRACHKVVDSFTGLLFGGGVPLTMSVAWHALGLRALPGA
jgi:hypothetical protein